MANPAESARTYPLTPADRVGVVAGSGTLPVEVAASLRAQGHAPFVIIVEGECDRRDVLEAYEHVRLRLEDLTSLVSMLKRNKITHLVLAGGIARRPALRQFRWGLGLLAALPRIMRGLLRGDDALLRAIIAHIEDNGIVVVSQQAFVPDLIAQDGTMTSIKPLKSDWRDIEAAAEAARAIGRLDIGQAAVAIGGRAVALEGIEGTAGLLERMITLRNHGRIVAHRRGVLAKCAKPAQDMRVDIPSIGPETVEAAHAAGLAGIAVDAGRAFVLDHDATIARANELGLFIVGLKQDAPR